MPVSHGVLYRSPSCSPYVCWEWPPSLALSRLCSVPKAGSTLFDPCRRIPPDRSSGSAAPCRSASVDASRVFPIAPGETRKITLKYTQLLDRAGDAWRFRYLGDKNRQSAPRSFRLEVDSAARFGDPYSPTHQVQVSRRDNRLEITLGENAAGGDFELLLPLAGGLVGLSLVPQHPVGEDGYFMLLLAPGAAADAAALRRDLVAVIDISGSMSGEKIQQAKSALIQLLGSLRTGDRFRLVAFSGGVRRYAQEWTGVSAETRRDAENWIRSLDAEGGTNIAGALAEAFAQAPAEQSLGVVVFLTDGQASTGETDPE